MKVAHDDGQQLVEVSVHILTHHLADLANALKRRGDQTNVLI